MVGIEGSGAWADIKGSSADHATIVSALTVGTASLLLNTIAATGILSAKTNFLSDVTARLAPLRQGRRRLGPRQIRFPRVNDMRSGIRNLHHYGLLRLHRQRDADRLDRGRRHRMGVLGQLVGQDRVRLFMISASTG